MAAETSNGNAIAAPYPTCMESVNRISKLPVVDCTIKTATSIYEKVKDFNGLTHWTLSTAETTLCKAVDMGKPIATPVIKNFEGPIKKVDDVLCSGLDYVEEKVPAVKLPPGQMLLQIYNTSKDYVSNTVTPVVNTAKAYAEPVFERAKSAVEPTVESVRQIVEPLVQPALDKAHAIKENVLQRVDEYIHQQHHDGELVECHDCQRIRKAIEEQQRQEQNQQRDHEKPEQEQFREA